LIKNVLNSTIQIDKSNIKKAEENLNSFITENTLLGKEKCKEKYQQKIVDEIRKQFKLTGKNLIKKQYNLFDKRKKDITNSIPWNDVHDYMKKWIKILASNEKIIENLNKHEDYRYFIDRDLPTVLTHELIHTKQWSKMTKKDLDITKMIKKYGEQDYYYHTYVEKMAHADTMLKQLKDEGFDNETIGKMLRQPKLYSEALMKSKSYRNFRNAIQDEKHWKRFMKYVYEYWRDKE
jgi:hypothetical protein